MSNGEVNGGTENHKYSIFMFESTFTMYARKNLKVLKGQPLGIDTK